MTNQHKNIEENSNEEEGKSGNETKKYDIVHIDQDSCMVIAVTENGLFDVGKDFLSEEAAKRLVEDLRSGKWDNHHVASFAKVYNAADHILSTWDHTKSAEENAVIIAFREVHNFSLDRSVMDLDDEIPF